MSQELNVKVYRDILDSFTQKEGFGQSWGFNLLIPSDKENLRERLDNLQETIANHLEMFGAINNKGDISIDDSGKFILNFTPTLKNISAAWEAHSAIGLDGDDLKKALDEAKSRISRKEELGHFSIKPVVLEKPIPYIIAETEKKEATNLLIKLVQNYGDVSKNPIEYNTIPIINNDSIVTFKIKDTYNYHADDIAKDFEKIVNGLNNKFEEMADVTRGDPKAKFYLKQITDKDGGVSFKVGVSSNDKGKELLGRINENIENSLIR